MQLGFEGEATNGKQHEEVVISNDTASISLSLVKEVVVLKMSRTQIMFTLMG